MMGILVICAMTIYIINLTIKCLPGILLILKCIRSAQKFPSSSDKHWFWGDILKIQDQADLAKLAEKLSGKHRRCFAIWMLCFNPNINVVHPDTAKVILRSTEPKMYKFGSGYKSLKPWIGEGLLLSEGTKWERNRKMLTAAFHFGVLKGHMSTFNNSVEVFLKQIEASERTNGDIWLDVSSQIPLLTLDVVLRCAFSYENNIQEEGKSHSYVRSVSRLSQLLVYRTVNIHLSIKWLWDRTAAGKEWNETCEYVHKFSKDIINSRKLILAKHPEASKKGNRDFLDILLSAKDDFGVGLSDQEIKDEVDTLLFAAHDTTASCLMWSLFALAKNPEEQDKLHDEICSYFLGRKEVLWEDLPKLDYLTMFIKEVLRMFSPVSVISRQLENDMIIDGVAVPAGMVINIFLCLINSNPEVWHEPLKFFPGRFAKNQSTKRDPFSFVPFSAGPRNCIGQHFALSQIKTVLIKVVQRFKVELDPCHRYVPEPVMILRPKYGLPLKFSLRA